MGKRQTYEGVAVLRRMKRRLSARRVEVWRLGWIMAEGTQSPFRLDYLLQVRASSRMTATLDALERCQGHRVQITCNPRPWGNGLGVDALGAVVECLEPEEHVLAALGGLPAYG